ncbi:MAG TPA: DUF4873 domain-containing protein [Streptosporangiaceae bacterium]|nr:DUF4873 domain-containing protein [Streptosporangiaceae bacterium]
MTTQNPDHANTHPQPAAVRPERASAHPEDDGYAGPARLTVGTDQFEVEIDLRGYFEPIDGQYHWYGRIASDDALDQRLGGAKADGAVTTKHGTSPCVLSEPDLWNRYRITGRSTPPFPVQTDPN